MTSSPETRKHFSQTGNFENLKKKKNHAFFFILWVFVMTSLYIWKKCNFQSNDRFFYLKCQRLRPIFMSARKNIFGQMVTLLSKHAAQTQSCPRLVVDTFTSFSFKRMWTRVLCVLSHGLGLLLSANSIANRTSNMPHIYILPGSNTKIPKV